MTSDKYQIEVVWISSSDSEEQVATKRCFVESCFTEVRLKPPQHIVAVENGSSLEPIEDVLKLVA